MAASCFFFDKLPAEMRNDIYELVYTPDSSDEQEVELKQAAPPSKALLLTCRQAYEEAHQIYKTAYQKYWRETTFTFSYSLIGFSPPLEAHVGPQKPIDINHITQFQVLIGRGDRCYSWCLMDTRGFWKRSKLPGNSHVPPTRAVIEKEDGELRVLHLSKSQKTEEVLSAAQEVPTIMEQLEAWAEEY